MNVQDFTYLLQHPEKVASPVQTKQLEDVLEEYPYFQAARALHLKGLKNLNSFKYNNALKVTAAHTSDRDVLFDFITSEDFLQNSIADALSGKSTPLAEREIESEEIVPESESRSLITGKDNPLPRNKKDADTILDPKLFKSKDPKIDKELKKAKKKAEEKLDLGKPLDFTKNEKHSFSEWLQLTSVQSIDRDEPEKGEVSAPRQNTSKRKKFDLIDKFIKTNPKIVPQEEKASKVNIKKSVKIDSSQLMTETLAKVYLEQKKYKEAIQAYKILSLKYPEKSSFFADRIKAVEKLQQDNL